MIISLTSTEGERERRAKLNQMFRRSSATFLATALVHELSQPLSAINSWSHSCLTLTGETSGANEKLAERLGFLANESRRATDIIRHFRTLMNRWAPEIADVDVNAVLSSVAELIDEEARAAGATISLALNPALPAARANWDLISMVAFILCRNSLDALESHDAMRKKIEVSTHTGNDSRIAVSVHDTGPGVDKETAGRLFEPLWSTKPHGAGIGLALCRTVLEGLGGRLWLEHNAPTGATFAFELLTASSGG